MKHLIDARNALEAFLREHGEALDDVGPLERAAIEDLITQLEETAESKRQDLIDCGVIPVGESEYEHQRAVYVRGQ